jgi:hypothetical protein
MNREHALARRTSLRCASQLLADSVAKVESCNGPIFRENLKRKEVDDSHSLSRTTEVAHEFGARR